MIRSFLIVIYSIYAWLCIALGFLLHFLVSTPLMIFFKEPHKFHQSSTRPFIYLLFKLGFIKLTVKGLDRLPKDQSVIYMSNHQSNLDILAYMVAIPGHFSFIAKKELFRVPILGWDIKLQGHISIDRKKIRESLEIMNLVVNRLKTGHDILIFPEGTRSKDGNLGPFKRFPFAFTQKADVPIVPCSVQGTVNIMPKGRWTLQPGHITVTFGESFDASELSVDDFVGLTREKISNLLG